ncbi:MAG: hypothetical protein JSU59_11890 [Nitrospirota bacterium]|nr:MAG: hypothetical protein JSU59_11890 [Nitrospirota bacterium]
MPLDAHDGVKVLQLMTSRFNQREWRKKIEKTLSLPPSGMEDELQRKMFLHLKLNLQSYKSRRADPPSWIVGGFGTQEVIDRVRFNPKVIDSSLTTDEVDFLGVDPGEEIDEVWWEEMLVKWFEEPEEEQTEEEAQAQESEVPEEEDQKKESPDSRKKTHPISQE